MFTATPFAIVAAGIKMYNGQQVSTNEVIDITMWDGVSLWSPPVGTLAIPIPFQQTVGIGYTYANNVFSPPVVVPPVLSPAQQVAAAYAALIAGGITITSGNTPALNGVYTIDPNSQAQITSIATYVATNQKFPNGTTSNLSWLQSNGTIVQFPTPTEFVAFGNAVAQLVYTATIAAATGAALPVAAATIP